MAAVSATQQNQVDRPVEICFAYVDDWRNVGDWLVGVEEFRPVGEQEQGLGAVFDAVVHAGVRIKSRLRVTDYVEQRLIQFDSVKGIKVRNRWNFEPIDDERTLITAESEVHPPFGPAGFAMAKVLEPAVKRVMERSAVHLKECLEASGHPPGGGHG
jgi:uncharacterized membrane protein